MQDWQKKLKKIKKQLPMQSLSQESKRLSYQEIVTETVVTEKRNGDIILRKKGYSNEKRN